MTEFYRDLENRIHGNTQQAYAVFDFDKTCINNDIQEMTYIYQAKEFCFRMSAEAFARSVRIHRELREVSPDYVLRVKALEDRLAALYEELTASEEPEAALRLEFSSGMLVLLEIANEKCANEFTYQWVLLFLKDYSDEEIAALAERVYEQNSKRRRECLTEHAALLSEFGLEPELSVGVTINREIRTLMEFLADKNAALYIVSASSYEVIAGVMDITGYSDFIPREHILALWVHSEQQAPILTIKEGKEAAIRQQLFPLYGGRNPIAAAGDSGGDFWMLWMTEEGGRVVVGENEGLLRMLQENRISYYHFEESV